MDLGRGGIMTIFAEITLMNDLENGATAGFVDAEKWCLMEPEVWHGETSIQSGV